MTKKPKLMPTEKAFVFVKNIEEREFKRAYEQGKLDLAKELLTASDMGEFINHLGNFSEHLFRERLKSQISKEGEKR